MMYQRPMAMMVALLMAATLCFTSDSGAAQSGPNGGRGPAGTGAIGQANAQGKADMARAQAAVKASDAAAARTLFAKACTSGHAAACEPAGIALSDVPSGAMDLPQARTLFGRGCDLGSAASCKGGAELLEKFAARSNQEVQSLYERACDGSNLTGCARLARLLYYGVRAQEDVNKARRLAEATCTPTRGDGCAVLAVFAKDGIGQPKDEAAFRAIAKRGCDLGDARSCSDFTASGIPSNKPLAEVEAIRSVWRKSCDLNYAQACMRAARIAAVNDDGTEMPQSTSVPALRMLLEKSCNLGHYWSCHEVAQHYMKGTYGPKDVRKARTFYTAACQFEDDRACAPLAEMLYFGTAGQDLKGAYRIADSRCRARDGNTEYRNGGERVLCAVLGEFKYQENNPDTAFVTPDRPGALALLRRACAAGVKRGCAFLTRNSEPLVAAN